jgi:hypothetical protein
VPFWCWVLFEDVIMIVDIGIGLTRKFDLPLTYLSLPFSLFVTVDLLRNCSSC